MLNGKVRVLAASLAIAALLPAVSQAQVPQERAVARETAQGLHQKAWEAYRRQQFLEVLKKDRQY